MKKVFSRFKTDGDGRISPPELAAVSRAITPLATDSAGGREVASMMDELDTDRDGYMDLGEFAAFHGHNHGEREQDAELRDAFDVYDNNDDGRISDAELIKVVSRIGEGLLVLGVLALARSRAAASLALSNRKEIATPHLGAVNSL
ncbi:probable calcium-binding protein CML16 [Hordeum vulgare subsp. vulgare]|uniref:probable calcium-binding protein CML16 n=1 Tax=Hordeum vulgare subsp. vulgare TaxID=112509 RepID=UPI001D1A4496|nr:probable calcium-binding protein CML16 [Hordeum vulgare subsp. vulgare]